MLAVTDIVIL